MNYIHLYYSVDGICLETDWPFTTTRDTTRLGTVPKQGLCLLSFIRRPFGRFLSVAKRRSCRDESRNSKVDPCFWIVLWNIFQSLEYIKILKTSKNIKIRHNKTILTNSTIQKSIFREYLEYLEYINPKTPGLSRIEAQRDGSRRVTACPP